MPDDKAIELLRTVYDKGCRHFDTAELYAQGDKKNEDVLGKFFATVPRESFTVGTKFWPSSDDHSYDTVKSHLVASLKRLQLDYVDLYYAHRVRSIECGLEFGRTMKRLKGEGLVKEVGLSEVGPEWLKKIHTEACPIDAIQQEWSLMTRNLEANLIPVCKELGIVVVAYSPLARNMLASKIDIIPSDWRSALPRYSGDNFKANQNVSSIVADLASKHDCTPAQLALAWLFHKAKTMGVTVVPIPGTTKIPNAVSNMEAVNVTITDENEMKTLEGLADLVAGGRYDDGHLQMTIEGQQK